jgi:hypothetical protein
MTARNNQLGRRVSLCSEATRKRSSSPVTRAVNARKAIAERTTCMDVEFE